MNLRRVLGLFAVVLLGPPLSAQAPASSPGYRFDAVDTVLQRAIADKQIPGAVLLVGHKGRLVLRKAYGLRATQPAAEPMTLDTVFDMASLTKSMVTAVAVMQLLGEGKFRLYDPVAKYLPEFGQNGKDEITIRQLLVHFSGLRPDLDLTSPWHGKETASRLIAEERPVMVPGTGFLYSDINYEILGILVERLSGLPLEQYAESRIFAPLGMKHTRFLPPPQWRSRIAPTEKDEQGQWLRGTVHDPTARRMGGVAGHAGLFSTGDDVACFAQAMLDAHGPLSPALIEKMTTPQQPPWSTVMRGFGWDIDSPFSSNRGELLPVGSYGHTGFTGTSLWIDPATRTYIILLTNAVHTGGDPWAKISLRTKVSNAVVAALDLPVSAAAAARGATLTGYNEAAAAMKRPVARNGRVRNGIDVLAEDHFRIIKGTRAVTRVGLLTNHTGSDLAGRRTIDLMAHADGLDLQAIFSPEHGITGRLDEPQVGDQADAATGVTVYSLYGTGEDSRRPRLEVLRNLDVVVVDLQDIGARFYTYISTLCRLLEAAAKAGTEVVVLDRPNPVTGVWVQGPVSSAPESFVNVHPLPVRHGMTIGELARLFNSERKIGARLQVVPMQGWQRGDWFDATGQAWVDPSPNMRSLAAAILYTGVALIEQTNVSVGRGTDRPFERVGAPWIGATQARDLADYLNRRQIAGVRFLPRQFTPVENRFAGRLCGGVEIFVTDRDQLDAPEMGIELAAALRRLYPEEFHPEGMQALLADPVTFQALVEGQDPRRIADRWREELERFLDIRKKYLLYP
jgi:uncharacterized protein YbbC (DUF1343 family)/CubicO group peptidase (beta-lactamase class C family)